MSNIEIDIALLSAGFKALSNPHRLAIFQRLMSCCEPGMHCSAEQAVRFCVGELGQGLDIAPSTLSHHLKELNRAGLINMARRGKQVECWVEPETLQGFRVFFDQALVKIEEDTMI